MTYWWFSFVDPDKKLGAQFLGACVVDADSVEEALRKTWDLKINPGGEVKIVEVPKDVENEFLKKYTSEHRNRLLSKKELNEVFGEFSTYDRNRQH